MIKKILFLFFVVFAATAYSQDVTITGTVTDANSEPLVGVNVLVKGTTRVPLPILTVISQ